MTTTAKKTTTAEPPAEDASLRRLVEEQGQALAELKRKWQDAEEDASATAELNEAQRERIELLEQRLAAYQATAQAEAEEEARRYTRTEVFVEPGEGRCLQCSCDGFTLPPPESDAVFDRGFCFACNHARGEHKRHPDGAVWKD